ncbi:hypothetical protein R1sor_010678 [Riccia sorocarpa]|uniref:Aminotransferase-like plant mobile domain-containing protein n=1 Tax=Riccia sorocarpa TaxID=122646 RepID=A0ABD3HYR0_9MARC
MLPYLSTIQRHCIASDVFFWGVFHADVEGDRLLITGMDGSTNVIGWNEIMVSFGAEHTEDEEFRSVKIMHKLLLPYPPCDFLPETVERNPNRELVNGGDYEEVHFYKEAAPYGPTFYLMSVIAELFWGQSKNPRFQTPQVYAYLRGLHGHVCNWAKAVLKVLRSEIANLQKLGKSTMRKAIPIVWAPLFMHILYWNCAKIFAGSSLEDSGAWVQWQMTTKEGDITVAGLQSKFPKPLTDLDDVRARCKLPDIIPVHGSPQDGVAPNLVNNPKQQKTTPRKVIANPSSAENTSMGVVTSVAWTVEKLAEELSTDLSTIILQKYGPILEPLTDAAEATLTWKAKFLTLEEAGRVAVEDARKIREEREKKIQDLQAHLGSVTNLWNSAKSNCEVKETQLQKLKQTELAVQAELEKLRASSKTTESKLKAELAAVRAELTDAKNGKNSLGAAQAEAQIQALKDEAASQKFKLDRAEQAQHEARTELATVKKQLRMSQLSA